MNSTIAVMSAREIRIRLTIASCPLLSGQCPAVVVVQAHDIVLAQIITALDFDQHQFINAMVAETMPLPDRYLHRFVVAQYPAKITVFYGGFALHHHPMFMSVMMQLQRQGLPGPDNNTLYLEQ